MSKFLEEIIASLPYRTPFLFVDELEEITNNGSKGYYQLKNDEYFYQLAKNIYQSQQLLMHVQ